MKICFVVNKLSFFLSHRLDLAAEIAKTYQLVLITDLKGASNQEKIILEQHNIQVVQLLQRSRAKGWKDWCRYIYELSKIIRKFSPQYIFYVTLELSMLGALLHNFVGGKKSFLLITGVSNHLTSNNFKMLVIRVIQKVLNPLMYLRKDHLFIFQNNDDRLLFVKKKMAYKNKTQVIQGNGVNEDIFKFVNRQNKEQIVFLFASRLLLSKGIKEFIEASRILKKRYPEIIFKVAGPFDPKDPESINKQLFNELCSEVEYIGDINHFKINEVLSDASIFVLPSYGEGLPKVVLEAGLTGLPLVLTNVPGCRDCIDGINENGFLVKARDSKDLEEKMELLILNRELRLQQGLQSNKYITKYFGNKAIQKEYLKLLND